MGIINTDQYYAVRGKIDGKQQYVDPDGYLYNFPTPLHECCFSERKDAKRALDKYISNCYPNVEFEIVKVTEQYKITKK
ncbi:MAG: hypothetical protein II937_09590 [Bacteroidales bacterium]|nr:hypothetical protein [Bacteroidales bacterium]